MKKNFRISNHFREQLKQEIQSWQTDGIINQEQLATISQKYQLDRLSRERKNYLLFAIYVIGAALIGAGVISFVAAHWDKIHPVPKIVLIAGCMFTCHILGFYLWKISGKSPRLGHALIVLGTLIFGANIGLLAQIFHIKENFYNGLFAWTIGAIIMAYALESLPNAVTAIIISFIGFCWWIGDNPHAFCYYPIVTAAIFLPFAYLRRSVLTFIFSLLALGVSIMVCAIIDAEELWAFSLATAGIGLLFFAWGLLSERTDGFKFFAVPAMVIATILTAMIAYISSFKEIARESNFDRIGNWMWTIPVTACYIIATILWVSVFKSMLSNRRLRWMAISILVSATLVFLELVVRALWPSSDRIYNFYFYIVIASNLACLVLCIGLIASSFFAENRGLFWAGILFAALIIITRFFEYETGLLLKAAVFTACGIGLILAGVDFENYLKKRRLINE